MLWQAPFDSQSTCLKINKKNFIDQDRSRRPLRCPSSGEMAKHLQITTHACRKNKEARSPCGPDQRVMMVDDKVTSPVADEGHGLASHVLLRIVERDKLREFEEGPIPPKRSLRRVANFLRQAPLHDGTRGGVATSVVGTTTVNILVITGHLVGAERARAAVARGVRDVGRN